MSLEMFYLLRRDEAGIGLQELDDAVLLSDVATDDGITIPKGTEGTVVAIWNGGEAYEVEFAEPEDAFATVPVRALRRAGHDATRAIVSRFRRVSRFRTASSSNTL